jgi:hypothetical protein
MGAPNPGQRDNLRALSIATTKGRLTMVEPLGVEQQLILNLDSGLVRLSKQVDLNVQAIQQFVGMLRSKAEDSPLAAEAADFCGSISDNVGSMLGTITEMQDLIRQFNLVSPKEVV